MKHQLSRTLGLAALIVTATGLARADAILFQEAFESGNLNQWTGKIGEPHHGQIVSDPLNPANHVLTFTAVNAAGDIFSAADLEVSRPRHYILSFDFLGLPAGGFPPAEYGGFIGISDSPAAEAQQFWLGGTFPPALNAPGSVATTLMADGKWHHYDIDFTEVVLAGQLTGAHLMLEDWLGLGSIPGDVFFDNLRVVSAFDPNIILSQVPCAGPAPGKKWKNHGQYVSTVSKVVEAYLSADIITDEEADQIMSAAGRSDCGKK